MLQQYNNNFLDKWDGSLDTLNLVMSSLNLVGLAIELTLMQLMSEGNSYYILNKESLGYTLAATDEFRLKKKKKKQELEHYRQFEV